MKSLIGYSLLLKILLLTLFFSFPQSFVQAGINEKAEVFYTVNEQGRVSFEYFLNITADSNYHTAISEYNLTFPTKDMDFFTIEANGDSLRAHRDVQDEIMQLVLDFDEMLLNESNPILLKLKGEFKESLTKEMGETKMLTLPGNIEGIDITSAEITYPKSFGDIPNFFNRWVIEQNENTITLKSSKVSKAINIVWGTKIAYDFEIRKSLSNAPGEPKRTFDLNVPKSHENQTVIFTEIEPLPNFAYQDTQGNIFFSYELSSDTSKDVLIKGQIQIDLSQKADPVPLESSQKPILTERKGYWLLDNEYEVNRFRIYLERKGIDEDSIEKMDQETRENFYKYTYDYVVQRLGILGLKETSLESHTRQGANHAVVNRNSSSPEDYVDLLSALYRSYSVPTRMLEGYVTLLNESFFHSWMEFWDDEKGWKQIDPALEDYSKGDYFETTFPNHITILSRGHNYIRPRMTFFNKEELQVDFSENLQSEYIAVKNIAKINPIKNTQNSVMGMVEIKNEGNTIISMKDFTNQEQLDFSNHNALQVILPGQTLTIPFVYSTKETEDDIYLTYTSINNTELINPIDINISEETFWWWNPLIITLKYTSIAIIAYIGYLILFRVHRWVEKYYQ